MAALLKLARLEDGRPEIFRSIQGEGPNVGRQRTFVRLSGCNLHCIWCDTAYTWNWQGTAWRHESARKFSPDQEMVKMSVEDAAAAILALPSDGVVVTGGEPLMQSDAVLALATLLRGAAPDVAIEVETNGTIAPLPELAEAIDLFMVSPKLAHSGNETSLAIQHGALVIFSRLEQALFKFVVRDVHDLHAIADLAARYAIPRARIFVMPEGTDSETLDRRGAALADAVIEAGWSYSDRLHIRLFGAKRGV